MNTSMFEIFKLKNKWYLIVYKKKFSAIYGGYKRKKDVFAKIDSIEKMGVA